MSDASRNTIGHTPGPWHADTYSFGRNTGDKTGWISAADGSPVVEYEGCGSHVASWPNDADLTLVLAAPDLLAALRDMIVQAEGASGLTRNDEEAIERARAAVAKATGNTGPMIEGTVKT